MGRYIALWHIGDVTRGEVFELGDREAKRLLALKAIQPVVDQPVVEDEPARRKTPEAAIDEAETEPEAETAEEAEEAEEETEDRLEIDPLADISEAKPEAPKKTRKSRKGA